MQYTGNWATLRGEAFALIMKRHLVSGDFETLRGYQEEMLAFTTIWSRLCIKWAMSDGVTKCVEKILEGLNVAIERIDETTLKTAVMRAFTLMGNSYLIGVGLSFLDTRAVGTPDLSGIRLIFSVDGAPQLSTAPVEKRYRAIAKAVSAAASHEESENFAEWVVFCQGALNFFDFLMTRKAECLFPHGITQELVETLHLEIDAADKETVGKNATRFLQSIYLTDMQAIEKIQSAFSHFTKE